MVPIRIVLLVSSQLLVELRTDRRSLLSPGKFILNSLKYFLNVDSQQVSMKNPALILIGNLLILHWSFQLSLANSTQLWAKKLSVTLTYSERHTDGQTDLQSSLLLSEAPSQQGFRLCGLGRVRRVFPRSALLFLFQSLLKPFLLCRFLLQGLEQYWKFI